MSVIYRTQHAAWEIAALLDTLSWRMRGNPFVGATVEQEDTTNGWLRPAMDRIRLPRPSKKALVVASSMASLAMAPLAVAWTMWPELVSLEERSRGVLVHDKYAQEGGVLARPDALTTTVGDGREVVRVSTPVEEVPADFVRAAYSLEGKGVLGIAPHNIARSVACLAARQAGLQNSGPLRLKNSRCAGASTISAQAVRVLTDQDDYSVRRKFGEIGYTLSLNLRTFADQETRERFIANNLRFGHAEGLPLIGIRNTALAAFGKEKGFELHESALLASMLLYPISLRCGAGTQDAVTQFEKLKARALYVLENEFSQDPRYDAARETLMSMEPLTRPVPNALAVANGLPDGSSCKAGSHPLLRLEHLDSSGRLMARDFLSSLGETAGRVQAIELTTSFSHQAKFKAQVDAALEEIAKSQSSEWRLDPSGDQVTVLAFATDEDGQTTQIYESSAFTQLFRERELASLMKMPALGFLASHSWGERMFCNKSAPPFRNAGGDRGVDNCQSEEGIMSSEEVWGRSVSLAVLDALRQYPPDDLREWLAEMEITVPENTEPAYAIAFGLARTTPARLSQVLAALSAPNAVGIPLPGIVASYTTRDGVQHRPQKPVFDPLPGKWSDDAIELISRSGKSALRTGGTLSAIGQVDANSIGKSGTLDTSNAGRVRFKGAAGALSGKTWFAMVVPREGGDMGNSAISILPLARVVRDHALLEH